MKIKRASKAWRYPEASERQLSRSISEMVSQIAERAKSSVSRMKFDATDAEVSSEESDLAEYATGLIAALMLLLRPISVTVYRFNTLQWVSVAKSNGGGSNPAVMLLDNYGPIQAEPWFREKQAQWESAGQQALTKLVENILADWSSNVRMMVLNDKPGGEVKAKIAERARVWEAWGSNRARGIVGSWNSLLMRQRLKDAGVDSYVWRGQLDERERLQHLQWEGKIIKFSQIHDFPGEPYSCRCWASPNFTNQEQ